MKLELIIIFKNCPNCTFWRQIFQDFKSENMEPYSRGDNSIKICQYIKKSERVGVVKLVVKTRPCHLAAFAGCEVVM